MEKPRKFSMVVLGLSLFLTQSLLAGGGKEDMEKAAGTKVKVGPIVDKIYMNVKMKQEIGLKDVAEGKSDIFFFGVDGPVIMGLDQATRDKLDIYSVPSGSWSLLFNPIPNKAPYTVKAAGREYFNPFAIREIRYAMNFLINRKYIVDEILAGAGGPMLTMATPTQPGTYKYNLVASRLGLSAEGDEKKAIADITAALEKAAAHPALKDKLKRGATWWEFNGEIVSIKFLIRVDDPQGRLKEGDHVANLIEKTGIKVESFYWDRSRCGQAVYGGDPADYEWNLYTEAWGAGSTRAFWEHIVAQMYAPWYGFMPGGQDPNNWNYQNPAIDEFTEKAYSGNFLNEDEYWNLALKGLELGLKDAVRIYICYQNRYYAANRERFNRRMVYGLGDGLNKWSLVTADTKDGILRITGFSAKGALFMHAWDPIGVDGFSDEYSMVVAEPATDVAYFESPATAIMTPLRAEVRDLETKVVRNVQGEVTGQIPVPADAIMFNSATKKWEKVGAGVKAMTKGTYFFKLGNYHHGQPVNIAAILYRDALRIEWMNKDGEDDKYYDHTFESNIKPGQKTVVGYVINNDGTITSFFNYHFPPSKERVAGWGAPGINVPGGRYVNVSWEIYEACAKLVAEGSSSGTVYSFTFGEATEPDLLRKSSVDDIRAKLVEMKDRKWIPFGMRGYISEGEVVASYEAAIKWINEKGHAFIGSGPFMIEKYDPTSNFMELSAFRDPHYPYKSDYWPKRFETTTVQIEGVELPSRVAKTAAEGIPITIYVSEVLYPEGTASFAEKARVSIMLITPSEEIGFSANKVEAGTYKAVVPAETLKGLQPGSYTILVNAEVEGAVPAAAAGMTTVY
jgi:peptide/nickel transport system substrate-binding protein